MSWLRRRRRAPKPDPNDPNVASANRLSAEFAGQQRSTMVPDRLRRAAAGRPSTVKVVLSSLAGATMVLYIIQPLVDSSRDAQAAAAALSRYVVVDLAPTSMIRLASPPLAELVRTLRATHCTGTFRDWLAVGGAYTTVEGFNWRQCRAAQPRGV